MATEATSASPDDCQQQEPNIIINSSSDTACLTPPEDAAAFPPANVTLPPKGYRRCLMEPLTLLFCAAFQGVSPLVSQYVYYRIAAELGPPPGGGGGGPGVNASSLSQAWRRLTGSAAAPAATVWCNGSGGGSFNATSGSAYAFTQAVQDKTSTWILYRDVIAGATAAVSIPLLSSWSDRAGRRVAIVTPCIGSLLESLVSLCVVAFDLPLVCLLAAAAASGLCGGIGCLFAGALAYLADITPLEARPMRITLLEALTGIGGAAACVLIGWWIRWQSYIIPHAFCTSLYLVTTIFCVFLVPEVRRPSPGRGQSSAAAVGGPCRLVYESALDFYSLLKRPHGLPTVYGLVLSGVFLYCGAFYGTLDLTVLYSMNYPFCLDSVLIGYYSALKQLALQLGMLAVVRILHPTLSTLTIASVGIASTAAGAALLAVAWNPTALWISIAASLAAGCPVPMYRAFVSIVTPADKQGCIFSAFGVLQMTAYIVGNLAFTYGYKATLLWQPGFVFYTVAATLAVGLLLTVAAQLAYRAGHGKAVAQQQLIQSPAASVVAAAVNDSDFTAG